MITSRRDYILRIIDEVSRLVARIVFKRQVGADQEALELTIQGFERLFNLERDKLFQLSPDHHAVMLTLDEPPEIARDKLLVYAALSAEAGKTYAKMGNAAMSRATYTNAIRFSCKARDHASDAPLPTYAPNVNELVSIVGLDRLDEETRAMLR